MAMDLATIVDAGALLKSVAAGLVTGTGITIAFSIAIYGTARFVDARRAGHPAIAGASALLAALAFAVCVAAIGAGLWVMTA
jgi:hypothetical protein